MADRPMSALVGLSDEALGALLVEVGRGLATPSATGLTTSVRRRLSEEAPPARSWTDLLRPPTISLSPRSRRFALVLALVVLALTAAVVGARLLDLPGLRFFFEPGAVAIPSPSAAQRSAAPSSAPGSHLGLGDAVSLADVEKMAGFEVLIPTDPTLGPPDAVYLDPNIGQGHVTMVWAAGDDLPPVGPSSDAGLIVSQFRGSLDEGYFAKIIHAGSTFGTVDVGGATGYWIDGDIHFFFYVDPEGHAVDDTRRLVGDVLAFERDGLTVRIETSGGRDRALEIARSMK